MEARRRRISTFPRWSRFTYMEDHIERTIGRTMQISTAAHTTLETKTDFFRTRPVMPTQQRKVP